jgi:hypothetical protein
MAVPLATTRVPPLINLSSGAGSVIDYGMVSRCLLPSVASFNVVSEGAEALSDYNALVCVVDWPVQQQQPSSAGFTPITTPCVKWIPEKREQYVGALSASQQEQLRVSIIGAMQSGQLSVSDAFDQWSAAVCDVAAGVLSVTVRRTGRMSDGRKANAWFRICSPEWRALRQAVL